MTTTTTTTIRPGIDEELTALVDHLLRTDTRLLGGAAAIGRIAVLPVPPPRPPPSSSAKPKRRKKAPRPSELRGRGDPSVHAAGAGPDEGGGDDDEDGEAPPPPPPAWKVAAVSKISDRLRAVFGDLYALVIVIAPSWHLLPREQRVDALVCTLRSVRIDEVESEDGPRERITIERPPIQCWADTADAYAGILAALADPGAAGAAVVSAAEAFGPSQEDNAREEILAFRDGVKITRVNAPLRPEDDEEDDEDEDDA